MSILLASGHLSNSKKILIDFIPPTFPETISHLERCRLHELDEMKVSILKFRVETWPGIALESTYVGYYTLDKARFVKHLSNSDVSYCLFKSAVIHWISSSKVIPSDPTEFLRPVTTRMVNEQQSAKSSYVMRSDESTSPTKGDIMPDPCQSNTNRLFHESKLNVLVPPGLLPLKSGSGLKYHPDIARKNRDAQREIVKESGLAYVKVLTAGAMAESGAKRLRLDNAMEDDRNAGLEVELAGIGGIGASGSRSRANQNQTEVEFAD